MLVLVLKKKSHSWKKSSHSWNLLTRVMFWWASNKLRTVVKRMGCIWMVLCLESNSTFRDAPPLAQLCVFDVRLGVMLKKKQLRCWGAFWFKGLLCPCSCSAKLIEQTIKHWMCHFVLGMWQNNSGNSLWLWWKDFVLIYRFELFHGGVSLWYRFIKAMYRCVFVSKQFEPVFTGFLGLGTVLGKPFWFCWSLGDRLDVLKDMYLMGVPCSFWSPHSLKLK